MVAIVSGNNTGLNNTSAGVLGQGGLFGNALHGSGKEGAYVNVFNGNLSLQDGDSFLAANGINLALTRTYNSQALLSDASNKGWQDVLLKQVKLNGTLNAADSTVQRTDADGGVSVFTYQSPGVYVSRDGGGGLQALTYTAGTPNLWTWTSDRIGLNGAIDLNGLYEVYDVSQGGNIVTAGDQVGKRLTYTYTTVAGTPPTFQIKSVIDASGDSIAFTYSGANLTKVSITPATGGAYVVGYEYDPQNRLQRVKIDMKPVLATDPAFYTTSYSYSPDVNGVPSQLITGVQQSDGTRLGFAYDDKGRVASYKVYDSASDLVFHTTSFAYADNGLATTVTDPLGHTVTYGYDVKGQLTSVMVPGVGTTSYTYDKDGNVLTVMDARGLTTENQYDTKGNRIRQRDAAGNLITRVYVDGSNLLLSETIDRASNDGWIPNQPQTTRYVYDRFNRQRYQVSAEGRVTEFIYPELATATAAAQVQQSATRRYTGAVYAVPASADTAITLAQLDDWVLKQATVTRVQTNYGYNTRGLVSQTTTLNNDGATPVSTVVNAYNANGQLLSVRDGNNNTTTYTYDTLGRQLTKVVSGASTQKSSFAYSYSTASVTMTETLFKAGSSTTPYASNIYTYDKAGELLSVQQLGVAGQTTNAYDAAGRQRMSTSPGGLRTYWLFDAAGRRVAEIDATGMLTELVYNQDNQLIRTIRYAAVLSPAQLAALALKDSGGNIIDAALDNFRPTPTPQDRNSWSFYDKAGRLIDAVDAAGYVTHYAYDGASRLLTATLRFNKVDVSALTATATANLMLMTGVAQTASPANDRTSRKLYDADGLLLGQVDALGALTEYKYNAAGLLIETIAYATRTADPASATLDLLRPALSNDDVHEYRLYDSQNRMVGSVNGDGYLTELTYDAAGNITKRISYASRTTSFDPQKVAPTKLAAVKTGISAVASADNRVVSYTYDALGRLRTTTNTFTVDTVTTDWVTTYDYDANGKLLTTTQKNGSTSSATYDAQGRVQTQTSGADAKPTVYQYDANGLLIRKTAPNDGVTVYYYDADGRPTFTVDAVGHVQQNSYNSFGQVVSSRSYATLLKTSVADLAGGVYIPTQDGQPPAGLPAAVDADQRTLFYYDDAGRLTYTVAPDGEIDSRSYGDFGQVATTVHYGVMIGAATLLKTDFASVYSDMLQAIVNQPAPANQVSSFSYDADGRLTYSVDPAGNRQGKTYDTLGRVSTSTQYGKNSADSVQTYQYNKRGLVTDFSDPLGNHIVTTYDGFGAAITQARRATPGVSTANPALDRVTRTIYDENGRVGATIDPLGVVTFYKYNGNGQVVDQVTYSKPIANLAPIDAQLLNGSNTSTQIIDTVKAAATATPTLDARQQFVYDARGRLTATYTATSGAATTQQWSVSTLAYDESDQVVGRVSYANAYTGDAPGTLVPSPLPVASTSDARVRMIYDEAGRLTDTLTALNTIDAAGKTTAVPAAGASTTWSLVSQQYDAFGNVAQRTAYAGRLSVATETVESLDSAVPAAETVAALKTSPVKENAVTVYLYDSANRVVLSARAQSVADAQVRWAVTGYEYNAAGQLKSTTDYAADVTLPAGSAPAAAPATAAGATNRRTSYTYDLANRLQTTTDALGTVVRLEYDTRGNVVKRTQHSPLTTDTDRVTRTVYDLNNQPLYQIDAAGGVTQNSYDALGNLTAATVYFNSVDHAALATTTVDKLIVKSAGNDRTNRYLYDQDGQRRFTLDAAGYLTQYAYDALGRVLSTTTDMVAAGVRLASAADYTLIKAAAMIVTDAATGTADMPTTHVTRKTYDAQGNVLSVDDAAGVAERYTYNALGNKLTYKNRLSKVWTYTYDAGGRLLTQADPAVVFYPAGATAATAEPVPASLSTLMEYDTFGNLTVRTEGVGGDRARTTGYAYDLRGRQVQTIAPSLAVYAGNADPAATTRTETAAATHAVILSYDALGNAITNRDVGDRRSYKVYDALGRVLFDIDALGYVTGYTRNGFGEVTALKRYATSLGTDALASLRDSGRLPDGMPAAAPALDRVVATTYDGLGRAVTVTEPAVTVYDQKTGANYLSARTTKTDYNALGQVYRQSVYGTKTDQSTTPPAVTRYYYDAAGNQTAKISALLETDAGGSGFLSVYKYDAEGKRTSAKEYATAISSWSDTAYATPAVANADRETTYLYDVNGRVSQEIQVAALVLANGFGNIKHIYKYDAAGNQTVSQIEGGTSTITYYDALGRTTAVAQVAAVGATRMPFSEFRLDGYGNVLVRIDYAGGAPAGLQGAIGTTAAKFSRPAPITSADRSTVTAYDIAGHAIQVTDAADKLAYMSYDVFGRLAKQWRPVGSATAYQVNTYDALGRLSSALTPGNVDLVDGATPASITHSSTFNAFGEATTTTIASGALSRTEYTDYDNAGHVWRTNAGDGIDKITLFDAQGNATVQLRSSALGRDARLVALTAGTAATALNLSGMQRLDTRYDLLGHALDAGTTHGNDLYFMVQLPDGSWVKQVQANLTSIQDGLLVIGDRGDKQASATYTADDTVQLTVAYRLKNSPADWTNSTSRVSWVDGYPVFNTSGLGGGEYEYRVLVQPKLAAAYQRAGGAITIQSQVAATKAQQLIRLYLLVYGRAPDIDSLSGRLAQANSGVTMAAIAADMLSNAPSDPLHVQFGANLTSKQILLAIYANRFPGKNPADPAVAAELARWAARMDLVSTTVADNRGQAIADLAQDPATVAALDQQVATLYNYLIKEGGLRYDTAQQLLAGADTPGANTITLGHDMAVAERRPQQLARVYIALFGRAPDKTGFDWWLGQANAAGLSIAAVAQQFLASPEWTGQQSEQGMSAAQVNELLINRVFTNLVGRRPDGDEFTKWNNKLNDQTITRGDFIVQVADGFSSNLSDNATAVKDRAYLFERLVASMAYAGMQPVSSEAPTVIAIGRAVLSGINADTKLSALVEQVRLYIETQRIAAPGYTGASKAGILATQMETWQLQLAQLYVAIYNRAPDAADFRLWLNSLNSGNSLLNVADSMLRGDTGARLYPSGLSNGAFIDAVYANAFGGSLEASLKTQWLGELATQSRSAVLLSILNDTLAALGTPGKAGRDLFNSKVAVGLTYALNAAGNDAATADLVNKGVMFKDGAIDISAAMTLIGQTSVVMARASAEATAAAANSAASLIAATLAAAKALSPANLDADSAAAIAAATPMAAATLRTAQLYVAVLARGTGAGAPRDLGNFINQVRELNSGAGEVYAAQWMIDSAEGLALYPADTKGAAFVMQFYRQISGGNSIPDPADLQRWTAKASSRQAFGATAIDILNDFLSVAKIDGGTYNGAELAYRATFDHDLGGLLANLMADADQAAGVAGAALSAAQDAQAKAAAAQTAAANVAAAIAAAKGSNQQYVLDIARLYVGILNRGGAAGDTPIDFDGFNWYVKAAKEATDTLAGMTAGMLLNPEGKKLFGGLTDEAFISKLYSQVLQRDMNGLDTYWLARLKTGESRGVIASEFVKSVLDTPYPLESEYAAAAKFDQRIALALTTFNNAKSTTDAIAKSASDTSGANAARNTAMLLQQSRQNTLNAANNATPESYTTVVAAQQAADYLNSPYLADLLNLRVALRMATDYGTMSADLAALASGARSLNDIAAAGFGVSLADRSAFFRALYVKVLDRQADDGGLAWWIAATSNANEPNYSNPGYLAKSFAQASLAELNGSQEAFPMRIRTNFAAELSGIATQNRNLATPLATGYSAALQNAKNDIAQRKTQAQSDYNAALAAYNSADADWRAKTASDAYARVSKAAVGATLTVVNAQDQATQSKAASLRADAALKTAQSALANLGTLKGNTASGMTAEQLIAYANSVVGTDNALRPDYNLTNALANAANAGVAMAAAAKNAAAAGAATQTVLQATQVYALLLNRAPTLGELNMALAAFAGGQTLESYTADLIAANPALSPANLSNDDFVRLLYRSFRSEAPDNTGLRYWSNNLSGAKPYTRAQLVNQITLSLYRDNINPDAVRYDAKVAGYLQTLAAQSDAAARNLDVLAFIAATAATLRSQALKADAAGIAALTPEARAAIQITQLYVMLLGRAPEPSALMAAIPLLAGGYSADALAQQLLSSGEIAGRLPPTLSDSDFVSAFYRLSLHRAPDDAERDGLVAQLGNGQLNRAKLVLNAIDAVYAYAGADLARLEARNLVLGSLGNAMTSLADAMANFSAVLGSGFGASLTTQLNIAMKTYASVASGVDSTTTDTVQRYDADYGLQVDRWGNVLRRADARDPNWSTSYVYNDNNQLILTSRTALAQDDAGKYAFQTLSTATVYDALGHALSTTDAKGNKTSYFYDDAGTLLNERHADSNGVVAVAYINDAFGQHTTVTQYTSATTSRATTYSYDKLGRQATRTTAPVAVYYFDGTRETTQAGVITTDTYAYDELGRRTSVTTTSTTTSTFDPNQTGGVKVYTRYDLGGNIISTIDAGGAETRRQYNAFNYKTAELAVATSPPDASMLKRWDLGSYGQTQFFHGADGSVTEYQYDASGQMLRQFTAGQPPGAPIQDIRYTYEDGTGLLLSMEDAALNQITSYSYDRAGNRVTEQVWLRLQNRAAQDQALRYDGFNRLTDIVSIVPGADYNVHYSYDANGNRTGERIAFTNDKGDAKVITVAYGYDQMDRQATIAGNIATTAKATGTIELDNGIDPNAEKINSIASHTIVYDWSGNRVNDSIVSNGVPRVENYAYDALGRLSQISDGARSVLGARHYDAAGRLVYSSDTASKEVRQSRYDRAGHLLLQRVADSAGKVTSTVDYGRYDRYNNLAGYTVTAADGKTQQLTTNEYQLGRDGYQLSWTTVRNAGSTGFLANQQLYDVNGNVNKLMQYRDQRATAYNASDYLSDAEGHILEKRYDYVTTHSLIVNGQLVGSSSANYESFSSVYESATSAAAGAGPGLYVVRSDTETLLSVAKALWGDQNLWYLLSEANGGISSVLKAGQQLTIPSRVNTVTDSYQTFTPYNKADAVGNTTPELAMPAPQGGGGGGGCGGIGKLIMVVVAVAVTIYTAGAAASYFAGMSGAIGTGAGAAAAAGATAAGSSFAAAGALAAGTTGLSMGAAMAAGAIGGAMGSIASQVVGMAIGAQDGFSWKGVALSAIGGGVMAGLPTNFGISATYAGGYPAAIARAAISNVAVQGISIATGLQDGFQWRSVAASAAGAIAGQAFSGSALSKALGDNDLVQRTAGGFVAGLSASVVSGGRINAARIATDAFGNALGQSLAENMKPASGNLLAIIRQQENAENSLPMNRTALGYEQRDIPLAERLGILAPDSAPEMSLARNLGLASGSAPVGDSSLDPSIQQVFVPHAKWTFEQNQAYDDAIRLPDSAPGQWMNDFNRGRGGEYRSAVEGPAPSGERFGRNVGAAAEFGKGMVGWHSAAQARDDWKKGNYGTAVVNGAAALGMAGSTILSAGTLGAARQAGMGALSETLAANEMSAIGSIGASKAASAAGIHPELWAAVNGEVNTPSLMRALRQSGTTEGAAVAKLLKRGDLRLNISDDVLSIPQGGAMPFGSNEMIIYKNYAGTPTQAAGLVAHESEHFLQGLTARQYANGPIALENELAAYSVQRRVDTNFFLRTDQEAIEYLIKSPLYPQINRTAADIYLQSGATYIKRLR